MGIVNINETLFASIETLKDDETSSILDNHPRYNVCIAVPPNILSDGIWGEPNSSRRTPFNCSFPIFLLQVILIYGTTRLLKYPLKKLGLPSLIPQMLAGLILGPMLPIFEDLKRKVFPYGSQDTLASITALGYVLFLFETGLKMDFLTIMRTGRKAWAIFFFGLVSPMIIGFATRGLKIREVAFKNKPLEGDMIIIGHTTTSFSVIVALLNDLKLLNSELGRLALSAALIADIFSNIVIAAATAIESATHQLSTAIIRFSSLFGIAIFILLIYRPAMFWIIEHTPEGKEVKDIYINIVIGILFSLCWFSGQVEKGPVFLPFVFGLATPEGPPLGSTLIKRINLLGIKMFLPIFVTTSTMKLEFGSWKNNSSAPSTLYLFSFVLLMGYIVKFVTCLLSALYFNMPLNDAISLSLLLNSKGVVQVTMYSTAFDRNDIWPKTFGVIILIIMVSICITNLLVKRLYDPSRKYALYQKRNLISLRPDSEVKILVVIHKLHHVTPITGVIDLFYPIEEDIITVDALHLIELAGRSSPIFISHKKKKVVSLNLHDSYSDNVVLNLKLYEHDKEGAAIVNPYTAVSPLTLMHEDVCSLALTKASSMIILPFHKRWLSCGKVEYDDKNIRSLNCTVLEKSPCSVGILVSRGIRQPDSLFRLALVFIGGRDDREALCLAKRAVRDCSIELVIYHIVDKNRCEQTTENSDTRFDIAMLDDYKAEHSNLEQVEYKEIEVKDGTETLDFLRRMVNEHDFIIVGRGQGIDSPQTSGLQEWSEFPELGPVGDFLASSDLDCKTSILVVHQTCI